jgi:hypothetical protein
MIHKLLLSVTA